MIASVLCLGFLLTGHPAVCGWVCVRAEDNKEQTQQPDTETGNKDQAKVTVDPVGHPGEYSAVLYDNKNGLPTSEANAIAETGDGFIWIGAYSGLIRYDGNTFERIDSTGGIASVTSLYVDHEDRLWVGTNDNGLALMENGQFQMFRKADGLPSSSVRAIIEDGEGNIYVGTAGGMAYIDSELHMHSVDNSVFSNTYIQNLQISANGRIYGMCVDGEIFEFQDGKIAQVWTSKDLGFTSETMLSMMPDPKRDDYAYFGGEFSKLYYGSITAGKSSFTSIDVSPLTDITSIKSYGDDIWITAQGGIGVIRDGGFHLINNLPMNNKIETQMLDYQGNLWYTSSRQGVMKLSRNQFTDIYDRYRLKQDTVNSTCMYQDKLFIGTDSGLTVLEKGREFQSLPVERIVTASGKLVQDENGKDLIAWLSGARIRSIIRDSKDRLWISTWKCKGLLCYNGSEVICYTEEDGMPSDRIRAVYEDGNRILAACTGGVVVIEDGRVTDIYDNEEGIENLEILTVCTGNDGSVITGTDGDGIYILKGKETIHVGVGDGLNSDVVMRIKKDDARKVYWIVTSNCIAYMTQDDYKVTSIENFPYSNNFDLYENKDGNLWILASNGIYEADADKLIENKEFPVTHYGIGDGLEHISTSNSYSELTEEGDLYISGTTGVVKVNIDESVYDKDALKLAVPYVIADGEEIYPEKDGSFTIPSSVNKLTIQGRAFVYTLANPQITYYLDGFDEDAVTLNRSEMTSHDYTNLAGGDYHYVMKVKDSSGEDVGKLSVLIRKEKTIFETVWFRIFEILIPAVVVAGLVYLYFRLKAIRERKRRELEHEYRKSGLASMLELYSVIYIINLSENTLTPIGGDEEDDSARPRELSPNEQLLNLFRIDSVDGYQEIMQRFANLDTIQARMKQRNSLTAEYESKNYGWCRVQYIAMDREAGKDVEMLLFTIQQIGQEKEEIDRIKGQVTKAESENKAKSAFLANMSHEIRTPINAVLGLNTMILRESPDESIRAYARDIKSAGTMLLSLINSVLDFSKLEAGKMEISPADYSLREMVSDICTIIKPRFEGTRIEFALDITGKIPNGLYGDDVRLKQIIINLLTNAVKYTDEGKVTLCIYGKQVNEKKEHLLFSVRDTGTGIRKEDLDKLTERFARIDETRNRTVEGTGIGINLVTGLLDMMDSELKVASVWGEGSEFYFELDQDIVDDRPIGKLDADSPELEEGSYQAAFAAPDAHILVVDDTDVNRTVFVNLLKETEIQIDEAASGMKALELTQKNPYHLIFMDHMMPQMDGVEAMKEIRAQKDGKNTKTPIIVLTANAMKGAREEYKEMGFDDFMGKPISPEILEEKIISFLPKDLCREGKARSPLPQRSKSEALPEITGVDTVYALQHVGSRDGVISVMKKFAQMAEKDRAELDGYYQLLSQEPDDEEALSSYRIKVHAMKSSASLCGALQVYGMAARLEQSAIKRNVGEILAVTPYFLDSWTELGKEFSENFGEETPEEEKEEISGDVLKELLHQLATGMAHYDIKAADSIISELSGYRLEDAETEKFEELKNAVAALDAESCARICEEIADGRK